MALCRPCPWLRGGVVTHSLADDVRDPVPDIHPSPGLQTHRFTYIHPLQLNMRPWQALDGRGFTPLLATAWAMNAAAAGALLSAGASVGAEDPGGCNALHLLTARPRDVAPGIEVPVDERCAPMPARNA